MDGRLYTVVFTAVSIAAQQEFFYIKPAADKPCVLEGLYIANVGAQAVEGDAKEDFWRVEVVYLPATVTVGSGGTAPTPNPVYPNDAAAGFTARVNDTTKASTSGTALTKHADGLNNRIPYIYLPVPEHRFPVANAAAMVVRLNTTPTNAVTMNGTAYVRELI